MISMCSNCVVSFVVFPVNVEVQTEKENDSDQERDESEKDQLLSQTCLLKFNSKLVLFLAQGVPFSLKESLTNIFHYD